MAKKNHNKKVGIDVNLSIKWHFLTIATDNGATFSKHFQIFQQKSSPIGLPHLQKLAQTIKQVRSSKTLAKRKNTLSLITQWPTKHYRYDKLSTVSEVRMIFHLFYYRIVTENLFYFIDRTKCYFNLISPTSCFECVLLSGSCLDIRCWYTRGASVVCYVSVPYVFVYVCVQMSLPPSLNSVPACVHLITYPIYTCCLVFFLCLTVLFPILCFW